MEIIISGQNVKVNDALEEYARKKLSRLDRYLPNITDVRVDFVRENSRRGEDLARAQITVRHRRGAILRAEESVPGDFQVALNQALDNMYRRIERFKGKRSRKGRERFSATVDELNLAEELPGISDGAASEEEEEVQITRRKEVIVTAMTEDEAIEQMELLGHNFFLFFNDDTRSINLIYKRRAGGYGILIPRLE
ncbi:MAG TPA: ribosome-associated translation inhibitor RaiA [Oceanobacillus sp.]|nr:ribosome-associated translation inhibitor RaiA [Oceanobacillus sp.]